MSSLIIVVPGDRCRCGRGTLYAADGSTRFGPFRVLATASLWAARRHGNDARDWRRPFGHPPTGTYVISASLPPGGAPRPRRLPRFGALGALVLTPLGGNALEAARAGRARFLLHGGPPDARGRLRPTFGGLRLADRDLAGLLRAVNDAQAAFDPVSVVEVLETVNRPPGLDALDRIGILRPGSLPPRERRAASLSLKHAALIALGAGIAGKGTGLRARSLVGRRAFSGLALVALGALEAGCSSDHDPPPPEGDSLPTLPSGPYSGGGDDGGGANGGYAGGGDTSGAGGYAPGGGTGDTGGYAGGDTTSGGSG